VAEIIRLHHYNSLTCLSILTTRDAKLIFDAYTSFAFDPCFPNIWSSLLLLFVKLKINF
jgi:hypothetical protein